MVEIGDEQDPGEDPLDETADPGDVSSGDGERGRPAAFVNGQTKFLATHGAADLNFYVWLSAGQTAEVVWNPGIGSGNGDLYVDGFEVASPDNYLWASTNASPSANDELTFGASNNSPPLLYYVNLHSTSAITGSIYSAW
jgi:hypothetical protein